MSTAAILIVLAIVALVAVILAARSGGPRVTTIERRTEHTDDNAPGESE